MTLTLLPPPRCLAALLLTLAASVSAPGAVAQTGAPQELRGTALDGRTVSLAALRGKVVVLFYWRTDCAVCRDKMPELRANAQGWRGKPFEMVLVSVDRQRADFVAYQQTVAATLPPEQRFVNLWRGDPGYSDSLAALPARLPLTLVLDTQGRVAARFEGRIPAEAWDKIADLMP